VINTEGASLITDDGEHGEPGGNQIQQPPKPMTSGVHRWLANIAYAILLVVMAVLPSTSRVAVVSVPDWFAHATAYGGQAALLYWASLPLLGHRRSLAVGLFGATAFGVVTETLQLAQPRRFVEVKDLAANTIGALLVCGVIGGAGQLGWRRGR